MKKQFIKTKALYQLFANILLWLAVLLIIACRSYTPGAGIFDATKVNKLVDFEFVITVLAAGIILFALFSLIRHRSSKKADKRRAEEFSELALDEIASALYNLGSFLVIVTVAGGAGWYIVGGIFIYFIGYYFKADDDGPNTVASVADEQPLGKESAS